MADVCKLRVKSKWGNIDGLYAALQDGNFGAFQNGKSKMFLYSEDGAWYFGKEMKGTSFQAFCKDPAQDPTQIKGTWDGPGGNIDYIQAVPEVDPASSRRCPVCLAVKSPFNNLRGGYVRIEDYGGYPAYVSEPELEKGTPVYLWYETEAGEWRFSRCSPGDGDQGFCFAESTSLNPAGVTGWSDGDVTCVEEVTWSIADPDTSERFQDPDFPASQQSTGLDESIKTEWIYVNDLRREDPADLSTAPRELFDKVEPCNLLKDGVGDCWFMAAITSMIEFPGHIESLFTSGQQQSADGKYAIKMYDIGASAWQTVLIDGRIPCVSRPWWERDARPIFSRPYQNDVRQLLLEKVYAKYIGSYMKLTDGVTSLAWQAFTGIETQYMWNKDTNNGSWKRFTLKVEQQKLDHAAGNRNTCPFRSSAKEPSNTDAEMFKYLADSLSKNFMISAAIVGNSVDGKRCDGLVEHHTYSLLSAHESEGVQLLELRSQWGGDFEWNGPWSDNSKEWAENPKIEAALSPANASDGMFWMSAADFFTRFTKVYECPASMQTKRCDFEAVYGKKEPKQKR